MSDAARLARIAFTRKAKGIAYSAFRPSHQEIDGIDDRRLAALADAAYAAAISYTEALAGIKSGSASWSVIKFYYSSFYSLKALLISESIVPFNCNGEMLLDLKGAKFLKGGSSSHHWNWNSLRKTRARSGWYVSADSQEAYDKLRLHRENVNYTHGFTDPELHPSLISDLTDIPKRIRIYRDDAEFFYTYLQSHLTVAYPTKLVFELDLALKEKNINLHPEQCAHLISLWTLKDRCPMT